MDWSQVKGELRKPLDAAKVRPPAPGKYGDYVEAHTIIEEANRIFGENGWSYNVHGIAPTNTGMQGDKHRVGYMAMCTVTVDGVSKTDVGHGQGFGKSEGDAHDSAVKEAATDSMKRALRTFGNPFGLALYDKTKSNVVDFSEAEKRAAAIALKVEAIGTCDSLEELQAFWSGLDDWLKREQAVQQEKDSRKTALTSDPASTMAGG